MSDTILKPEHVTGLAAHLSQKYGSTLVNKQDAIEMKVVAQFVGLLGIDDPDAWMKRWAITVGNKIYFPFVLGDPSVVGLWDQILTIIHEHEHIKQHQKHGFEYYWSYLKNHRRALWEAEAYRTSAEMWYWRKGWTLDPNVVLGSLTAYGLSPLEMESAKRSVDLSFLSIHRGARISPVVAEAIKYLEAHVPDLKGS